MATGGGSLTGRVEEHLWPLVEARLGLDDLAGVAVGICCEGEVATRGFGVRDVGTGDAVTADTMFHLASVSKLFVATAVVPMVDLDAPVTRWVPELELADGRAGEVTARHLLTHTSGLPDVTDYGWHDPQLGDEALVDLVRSLADWRLRSEPGTTFTYSNAGYEVLGLQLARAAGTTFEEAVRRTVLAPLGMTRSTFLRGEVPAALAASPHVGMPLVVPGDSYPYTRRHAPSSTLHSNLVELCRWMAAHLDGPDSTLEPSLRERLWRPAVEVGEPPWDEQHALGWAVGTYRGHRLLSHSGADPGFGCRLALVPDRRTGVAVLSNSNTVPVSALARAALDVALGTDPAEGVSAFRGWLPSAVGPVARALASDGPDVAAATFSRLVGAAPATHDVDDEVFDDAVWGAIELHRTDLVRPLLAFWTELRPGSSSAWTMAGWADLVDGHRERASAHLRRAVQLDPANADAEALLATVESD